jgi:hypothetical protein
MSADDLFLGYIPKNFNDDGKTTCLMVGAMVVTELFFTVLVIVTAPKGVKDRLYYSSCILCIPKVVAMFYFAWQGTAATFDTLESRTFSGRDFNTEFFCAIYIAHSIFGILNEATKDGMNLHTLPMFIHHMASIVSFGVSMYTSRFIVYTAYCGLCEITNIPLSILYLSKTKGGGVAKWMEKNFGVMLSVMAGCCGSLSSFFASSCSPTSSSCCSKTSTRSPRMTRGTLRCGRLRWFTTRARSCFCG